MSLACRCLLYMLTKNIIRYWCVVVRPSCGALVLPYFLRPIFPSPPVAVVPYSPFALFPSSSFPLDPYSPRPLFPLTGIPLRSYSPWPLFPLSPFSLYPHSSRHLACPPPIHTVYLFVFYVSRFIILLFSPVFAFYLFSLDFYFSLVLSVYFLH